MLAELLQVFVLTITYATVTLRDVENIRSTAVVIVSDMFSGCLGAYDSEDYPLLQLYTGCFLHVDPNRIGWKV